MNPSAQQGMRIYLISGPALLQKTLQSFLTDLGHEVIPMTVPELRRTLGQAGGGVSLAFILNSLEKSLLQAFHCAHPETMLILWNENGSFLSTAEALAYGVYAFLHPPLHFNELEVLLYRLAQYYTRNAAGLNFNSPKLNGESELKTNSSRNVSDSKAGP